MTEAERCDKFDGRRARVVTRDSEWTLCWIKESLVPREFQVSWIQGGKRLTENVDKKDITELTYLDGTN